MNYSSKFTELCFSEQLLVWAMRVWDRTSNPSENLHHILRDGLAKAGVPNAYIPLDSTMTILQESSLITRQTGCPDGDCKNFEYLWALEKLLLIAIAELQLSKHWERSNNPLRPYIRPTGMRLIAQPIDQLAATLLNSNILIPLKEWDIQLDRLLPNESPEVIQERVFH